MSALPPLLLLSGMAAVTIPRDDPVVTRYPPDGHAVPSRDGVNGFSSNAFPWDNVALAGSDQASVGDPAAAYKAAAKKVLANNSAGGVVFFPAGKYAFTKTLELVDGVVLRGAPAAGNASGAPKEGAAKPGPLAPTTIFTFPDRAGAKVECVNCTVGGVVNVQLDGAGVSLTRAVTPRKLSAPPMFVVVGNVLVNVAYKYPVAPPGTSANEWPYRFTTAIEVSGAPNVLIANNHIAKATASKSVKVSFENKGGSPSACTMTVPFPYDNRYGIWYHGAGTAPTTNVTIADNYVHMNGRVGVLWASNDGLKAVPGGAALQGSGVAVVRNHVETLGDTTCWTVDGVKLARGSSTNENRGYDQQGTGSYVAENTGAIRRQITPDGCKPGSYRTVDGEGILQQIQDGATAERNIWHGNDLRASEYGPIELYALHAVLDMTITDNFAGGYSNDFKSNVGLTPGGSTPKNGTGISNLHCSGNKPTAKCSK